MRRDDARKRKGICNFVYGGRKEYGGIEMMGRNNVRRGVSLVMETAEKKSSDEELKRSTLDTRFDKASPLQLLFYFF